MKAQVKSRHLQVRARNQTAVQAAIQLQTIRAAVRRIIVQTTRNNSSNNSGSSTPSSGKTMIMESTAYSYAEKGASHLTASGTDLRSNNPMAVAVDPSVIPLGTLVNVEGYGVALALDTGGAIKGNIIDVHFDNVAKCLQWGRRQVKVTILD